MNLYYSSKEEQFWPIAGNPIACMMVSLSKNLYKSRNTQGDVQKHFNDNVYMPVCT